MVIGTKVLPASAAAVTWWLVVVLPGVMGSGGLLAQEEVSMKLDFVAWGDAAHGLSLPEGDGEEITARAFSYSTPVSYTGPRLMEIHQTGDAKSPEPDHRPSPEDLEDQSIPLQMKTNGSADELRIRAGALARELEQRRVENPTLVALARLPANSRRATVLLVPAESGTYHTYVINDDPTTLRPGHLRVHNLSPHAIAFRTPQQSRVEITTGRSHNFPAREGQLIYEFAYQRDGQWVVQENNVIPVRPREQTQMIILRSRHQFFLSADGASGGYLQAVFLRRRPDSDAP